jgi:hypothetical protein
MGIVDPKTNPALKKISLNLDGTPPKKITALESEERGLAAGSLWPSSLVSDPPHQNTAKGGACSIHAPKPPPFWYPVRHTVDVSVTDLGNVVYVLARQWPTCWGDYLQFVLYKENKDTTAAVGLLAKFTKYDATFL